MAYQIIRTVMKILAGAIVLIVYLFQVNSKLQAGLLTLDNLQPLAQMMLIFIGIGIGVLIAVEIVFHICFSVGLSVKEGIKDENFDGKEIENTIKQEMVEDEMSKLIDLKSLRVGYIAAGIGCMSALILLALGHPAFTAVNIVFSTFFAAEIVEECTKIYYYKKGI